MKQNNRIISNLMEHWYLGGRKIPLEQEQGKVCTRLGIREREKRDQERNGRIIGGMPKIDYKRERERERERERIPPTWEYRGEEKETLPSPPG